MLTSKIDNSTLAENTKRISETTWIVTIEEDPETGELVMPLPMEALESNGWKIGDTLTWEVNDVGEISLTKK